MPCERPLHGSVKRGVCQIDGKLAGISISMRTSALVQYRTERVHVSQSLFLRTGGEEGLASLRWRVRGSDTGLGVECRDLPIRG